MCQDLIYNTKKNFKIMKTYKAWTRTANTNDSFCTQYIKAKSLKEAKLFIIQSGREIQKGTKVYL